MMASDKGPLRAAADFVTAQRALADDYGFACYEDALRSWIATVAIVEVGYVGEWEKYAAELMAREYLNELMLGSDSPRRGGARARHRRRRAWRSRGAAAAKRNRSQGRRGRSAFPRRSSADHQVHGGGRALVADRTAAATATQRTSGWEV
jgi:hypothetical protein